MRGIDETWQADLVEMIPYFKINKGFRYLLTVIDIFAKYAWAVPVRSKWKGYYYRNEIHTYTRTNPKDLAYRHG